MQHVLAIFVTVFLAELGDKTQLATLLYATGGEQHPLLIFCAAAAALVASTALAVGPGDKRRPVPVDGPAEADRRHRLRRHRRLDHLRPFPGGLTTSAVGYNGRRRGQKPPPRLRAVRLRGHDVAGARSSVG